MLEAGSPQRAAAMRSATRTTSSISRTPCTRTMCAPSSTLAVTAAAVAHSRAAGLLVAGEDAALDAWAVARILKAVIEREKPDLVVLGKQAVDGDSNQVGQILAGLLGWPQATFLATVRLAADGKSATVTREVDAGVEEKRVRVPAVLTVDLRIISKKAVRNEALAGADAEWEESPRYASLKGIMAAKKKEIKDVTLAELGVDAAPTMKVQAYEAPPQRQAGVRVASVDELVAKLHGEAKVI